MTILLIPIEANVLFVDRPLRVVRPRLDMRHSTALDATFSLLREAAPHVSEQFLTTTLFVDADSEKGADNDRDHLATLPSGLYLHWSVPDALTVARRHPWDTKVTFPSLPNRWLIQCEREGRSPKYFLIKSDQMYAMNSEVYKKQIAYFKQYGIDLEDLPLCQVPHKRETLPGNEPASDPSELYAYSYMGTQEEIELGPRGMTEEEGRGFVLISEGESIKRLILNAEENTNDGGSDFDLTVLGYGEPTFAAIMSNSFNVFSAIHPLEEGESNQEWTYTVRGWYSDASKDCLSHFSHFDGKEKQFAALKNEYGWDMPADGNEFPERTIFYKKFKVTPARFTEPDAAEIKELDCKLAIGTNGVDALSSILVGEITAENSSLQTTSEKREFAKLVEEQFEAFSLDLHLHHKQQDILPTFEMLQHRKGFKPLSGGIRFHIKIRENKRAEGTKDVPTVRQNEMIPLFVAEMLNDLNRLQDMFEHVGYQLEGLRANLFDTYVFYQYISNIAGHNDETYPDPDDVWREMLRQKDKIQESDRIITHGNGQVTQSVIDRYLIMAKSPELKGGILDFLDKLVEELEKDNPDYENRNLIPPLQRVVEAQRAKVLFACDRLSNDEHEFFLEAKPAPHFYRPIDPAILIELIGKDLPGLTTMYGQSQPEAAAHTPSAMLIATDANWPDDALVETPLSSRSEGASYYKSEIVALEWEASIHPIAREGNFTTGYVHDHFSLQENFADLSIDPNAEILPTVRRSYRGHTVLVPHAADQLKKYLDDFEERNGRHGDVKDTISKRLDLDDLRSRFKDRQFMSQSLGGLHQALLMRETNMQLPLYDLADFAFTLNARATGDMDYFDKIQAYAELEASIDRSRNASPILDSHFQPLRSGVLNLVRLRLIDSFGRIYNLNFDHREIAKSSSYQYSNHVSDENADYDPELDHYIYLPPRINQFAQLDFRWLAADVADTDSSDHPSHGPICGWLLPNNLEQSLMVYDNEGNLLGYINALAEWVPAPGMYPPIGVGNIANPHLRQLIKFLVTDDIPKTDAFRERREIQKIFINHFFDVVEDSLESIDPEDFDHHQALSLLVGRPVALVRASLEFRTRHLLAENKRAEVFISQVEHGHPPETFTEGYEHVKFPVRIGDHLQLHDGLVGYWIEGEKGEGYQEGAFYAPNLSSYMQLRYADQAEQDPDYPSVRTRPEHQQPAHTLSMSLSDEPVTLSMLVDPRGAVHVTSGILPKIGFEIPSHLYAEDLKNLAVTFLTTPLVTDTNHIRVPMPSEPGFRWSWVQKDTPSQWNSFTDVPDEKGAALSQQLLDVNLAAQQIVEGWLRLTPAAVTDTELGVNGSNGAAREAVTQGAVADESAPEAAVASQDLAQIKGIGPKVVVALLEAGITTYAQLANTDPDALHEILDAKGYHYMDAQHWPEQAKLADAGQWEELQKYQDTIRVEKSE